MLNLAHIHVILAHGVPVAFLATVIALLFNRGFSQEKGLRVLTFVVAIVAVLGSTASLLTGEDAANLISPVQYEGDHEHYIHEHEEMAETAWYFGLAAGILAIWWFIAASKNARSRLLAWWATFVLFVVAAGLMMVTALNGGQIRHPSARPGWVAPAGGWSEEAHEENGTHENETGQAVDTSAAQSDTADHADHDH